MRQLVLVMCLALSATSVSAVHAQPATDRAFTQMVSGVYLLVQKDGYQRLLTLDPDGTVSQVSQQQAVLGFTTGQGAWSRTGEAEITAQIIDFDFNPRDGKPTGSTLIRYVLTLSAVGPSGFQHVAGAFSGKQYPPGQSPLDPGARPVRQFGVEFTGQRVPAPPRR
jgi:hypothetical protein